MKKLLLLQIVIILLFSCNSFKNSTSSQINAQEKYHIDSTIANNIDTVKEFELYYEDVLNEYRSMYNDTISIDTVIQVNNQLYKLKLKHYCLFDTLIIPSKYSWDEETRRENFITHNFASKIILIKQNDTIFNRIIVKDVFNNSVDSVLRKYGVLLSPVYRGFNPKTNKFIIGYSFSIPLTDIGQPVSFTVGLDGVGNPLD